MAEELTFSFRFFPSREVAEECQFLLRNNGVDSILVEDSGDLAKEFLGDSPHHKFELLIDESKREIAELLLMDMAMEELENIDRSHFLFDFSDEELMDVLVEKHEWNEVDVLLSQKILRERGINLSEEELERKRQKRLEALAQPDGNQTGWLIFGYISILLAPFVGAVLGFALMKSQKRLPNGVKVPRYSTTVQNHGKLIAVFSLLSLIVKIYFNVGWSFGWFEF